MEIVEVSTQRQLEDEALGFVKDGWNMFEIKMKLFDEAEFDEEIRRISRPRERVPRRWEEPDPHELMHVEGLSLNNVFLLRFAECRGKWRRRQLFSQVFSQQVQVLRHIRGMFSKLSPPLRRNLHPLFHSV